MATGFYGKYRAQVVDNADPEQSGQIRVQCPKILGDLISNWALPCLPPNTFGVPPVGTMVWLEFEDGDTDLPIWSGCLYTTAQWSAQAGGFDTTSLLVKNFKQG